MDYDVIIVGAGPSGLSAAITLKQKAPGLRVCILEKGASVGAHLLSGAVLDPRALSELLSNWRETGAPLTIPVRAEQFLFLTQKSALPLPVPSPMTNHGNFIIRLGVFAAWLADIAAQLGVDIFPGVSVQDLVYENGKVCGIKTGDMGLEADGTPGPRFEPGFELRSAYVLLSEGCRGSLSEQVISRFGLRDASASQTYGLGVKEVWQVESPLYKEGTVLHSVGWPLDSKTYGGTFIYHLDKNQVALGIVVGLDYENPTLRPHDELQRFKTHPEVRELLKGGKRLSYGARALNEGGLQSLPKLTFPGGMLLGCSAGFLNVPRIKGIHLAMKSGMLAAEAVVENWQEKPAEARAYEDKVKASWMMDELKAARNVRPAFRKWGLYGGLMYSALDQIMLKGRAPWTLGGGRPDHLSLKPLAQVKPILYPKPDGILTFDILSSVYLSGTNHREGQPKHLILKDPALWAADNATVYGAPETNYCPAGVYECVKDEEGVPTLHIQSQNCIHCKTCDIKDKNQNITWVPPEGGDGPRYSNM